ncbi:MAG: pitrilysin family protein [Candidatus Zixiibacteriota bacterium]
MRSNATYKKTVLKNGLRVITEKVQDVRSIAIGIWVDVGSRDELPDESGLSHFIEHMVFKGTKSRSPQKIASSLESLGGSLNAFTSREQTCFHALVLDEHLGQAVDVLSDILTNSTITPLNIIKEKQVVMEEINEVYSTPSDHIHDLFSNCFWRGQPLGWSILGNEATVNSFKRRDVINYIKKHYHSGRIVVSAAGNISHNKLVDMIEAKLNISEGADGRGGPAQSPTDFKLEVHKNGINQTHVCIGFPGVGYSDMDKYALLVLHYYLGGGMSSKLFQKIREQKGLVYTIFTFPDYYRDNGVFGAYFATDKKSVQPALELMLKEFSRLKRTKLTKEQMINIKDQCKGHLLLGMESTTSRMNRLARQEIMSAEYKTHLETIDRINSVKSKDVIEIARKIFNPEGMTITTLGNTTRKNFANIDWSI